MANARNFELANFANSLLMPYMNAILGVIPHFVQQITSRDYTKDVISRIGQMSLGLNNIRQTSRDLGISSELLDPIQILIDRRVSSGFPNNEFSGVIEELKISQEKLQKEKITEKKFSLTLEDQKNLLDTFNQIKSSYPSDLCIHQLFEQQVERNSEAIALIHKEQTLSYGELNRKANRLSHYLIKQGVEPNDRVGLCFKRGLSLITTIFAILKTGAAYVPVDPTYPCQRLLQILNDAQPKLILADAAGKAVIGENSKSKVLEFEEIFKKIDSLVAEKCEEDNPQVDNNNLTSDMLAYIIYTSGSTGV